MTGLVIDSSSPAAANSTTPTVTTAAFTPPPDPLLLAAWAANSTPSVDPPDVPNASSSPSHTWTRDAWDRWGTGSPQVNGQAAFFHSLLTGTPGSHTVSVLNGSPAVGQTGAILKVYAMTGHDPVDPIGQTGGGRAASPTSISASYNASITGGQGFMVVSDWMATDPAAWTVGGGCTVVDRGINGIETSYMMLRRTDPDGVYGAATTMTVSGFVGTTEIHYAYAEVISLEAAVAAAAIAGYPAFGANAPMF